MTTSTPTSTIRTFQLYDDVSVTVEKHGVRDGTAVLMLHGGAGPRSVTGLSNALTRHAYVLTPTHPGFDGRPRPERIDSIPDLAVAYLDLLEKLGVHSALVIGSSFGGWIGAEMALRDTRGLMTGLVLIGGVGIEPDAPLEIASVEKVGPAEFFRMAYHNPALRPNPAALSDEQRAALAANQRTATVYAGTTMYDPKLRRRLHRVTMPVLALYGEQDGIVPLEYGRAFANSFPHARFVPVGNAAHFPHMEQPERTVEAIEDFVGAEIKPAVDRRW